MLLTPAFLAKQLQILLFESQVRLSCLRWKASNPLVYWLGYWGWCTSVRLTSCIVLCPTVENCIGSNRGASSCRKQSCRRCRLNWHCRRIERRDINTQRENEARSYVYEASCTPTKDQAFPIARTPYRLRAVDRHWLAIVV